MSNYNCRNCKYAIWGRPTNHSNCRSCRYKDEDDSSCSSSTDDSDDYLSGVVTGMAISSIFDSSDDD